MNTHQYDQNQKAKDQEKKQISILRSGNNGAILETVKDLRQSGRISILPEIFEIILDTEDDEVHEACTGLLNDLNDQESTVQLISALKNPRYRPIRKELIAACWQNGLDYKSEVLLFAKFVVKDDYAAALEAFTVIENCLGDLNDEEVLKLTSALNDGMKDTSDHKKKMIKELLKVIRDY